MLGELRPPYMLRNQAVKELGPVDRIGGNGNLYSLR